MPGGRNGSQRWGGHQPNGRSRREDHWGDGGAYGFRGGPGDPRELRANRAEGAPSPAADAPRVRWRSHDTGNVEHQQRLRPLVDEPVPIFVCGAAHGTRALLIQKRAPLASLRAAVRRMGYDLGESRLCHLSGAPLPRDDRLTLAECGLHANSSVHMTGWLLGGGKDTVGGHPHSLSDAGHLEPEPDPVANTATPTALEGVPPEQELAEDSTAAPEADAGDAADQQKAAPVSATATSAANQLPSAAEFCGEGTGLSTAGIRHCVTSRFGPRITDRTTTSDLCHGHIKPATLPRGWVDEPELLLFDDAGHDISSRCWYKHVYRRLDTEETQSVPPPGTRSMCAELAADPATTHFVGKPTHFLSHAWLYKILNVVGALEEFEASQPEGSPSIFWWFDCFAIDEHATQALSQEWWSTTFKEAIAMMGHTVMVLSPWDAPQPLKRAWCLWELYCTVEMGAEFSVCLGADERNAFEAAILEDFDVVFDVFATISVEKAEAGDPRDQAMIKAAVAAEVGFARLDAMAFERMRVWIFGVAHGIVERATDVGTLDSLWDKHQVGALFYRFGQLTEAKALYKEVIVGYTQEYGADHEWTLMVKSNLATLLKTERTAQSIAEAKVLYKEVIAGETLHYGADNEDTLQSKGNLANVLDEEGTTQSVAEAKALYIEVLAGHTKQHGPDHLSTLLIKGNFAMLLKDEGTAESMKTAHALFTEVLVGETRHYGAGHDQVLQTKGNFAELLHREGTAQSIAEAKTLYEEVVAGRTQHYGPDHVQTLDARADLALLLADDRTAELDRTLSDVAEAATVYKQVIARFTQHYGTNHLNTLQTKGRFAEVLAAEGETDQALAEFRLVLLGFEKQELSPEHPWFRRIQGKLEALEQTVALEPHLPTAKALAQSQAQEVASLWISGFPTVTAHSTVLGISLELSSFNGQYTHTPGEETPDGFPAWHTGSGGQLRFLYFHTGKAKWIFNSALTPQSGSHWARAKAFPSEIEATGPMTIGEAMPWGVVNGVVYEDMLLTVALAGA